MTVAEIIIVKENVVTIPTAATITNNTGTDRLSEEADSFKLLFVSASKSLTLSPCIRDSPPLTFSVSFTISNCSFLY